MDISIMLSRSQARLVFYDVSGKVTWSLPAFKWACDVVVVLLPISSCIKLSSILHRESVICCVPVLFESIHSPHWLWVGVCCSGASSLHIVLNTPTSVLYLDTSDQHKQHPEETVYSSSYSHYKAKKAQCCYYYCKVLPGGPARVDK